MPRRRSAFLVGLLLLPFVWMLGRSAPQQSQTTLLSSGSTPPKFPAGRLAGAMLSSIVVVAGVVFLFDRYEATLPQIGQSPPRGGIYLYFDRPYVDATLKVWATSNLSNFNGYKSDNYGISISVDGIESENEPRFTIVLAGSALPKTLYPDGSERPVGPDGCILTVGVSNIEDVSCTSTWGAPESLWAADEVKEELLVISGKMTRLSGATDSGYAYVNVLADGMSVSVSGERRIFQLPTVGTSYLSEHLRGSVTAFVDRVPDLYVPDITTIVSYERLSPSDILENVSVEPLDREPLTWGDISGSSITPSGTIIDGREQRNADRGVFVWGVLAGVVGGFLPAVIGMWASFVRGCRAWMARRL